MYDLFPSALTPVILNFINLPAQTAVSHAHPILNLVIKSVLVGSTVKFINL